MPGRAVSATRPGNFNHPLFPLLELDSHRTTDAVRLDIGIIAIVETPNVVEAQELEDVLDTYAGFHIRSLAQRHRTLGESEEAGALGGIILVREVSPKAPEAEDLAPFELFDKRDTVQQQTIHVVSNVSSMNLE